MIHHIYPVKDVRPHDLEAVGCTCSPKVMFEDGDMLIVHNSFDLKEITEDPGENTIQ